MPESQNDGDSSEPSGHLSAEQVLGMIERVLLINQSSEQDQDILRSDEVQTLQRCRERLLALGPPGLSAEEPDLEIWFQREITTGTRRPLVFYINLDTFETAWAPGAPHLDIATLLREVERLTGSRRERNRQSRQSARGMQRFEVEGAERQVPSDDGRSSLVDAMSAAQRPFLPTMRRPGSSHEQSSMPWKYFMQITLSLIMAWLVTTVYCLVHPDTGTKTRLMQTSWPHDFFEPAAMSCAGDQFYLGDRFGMYASQTAATGEPGRFDAAQIEIGPEPEQSGQSGHGHMPWAPFASIAALKSGPTQLLVLQHDGRVIWELHRNYNKIWNISSRLPEPVRAIAVIAESVADRECAGYGEQPWGVLASSWAGETLVLCPKEGTLHPRRRISKMEVHGRMVETIGMHLTSTSLWVLAKSVEDGSSWLVRQARSGAKDIHQLPQGRSWATGLCGRSNASEEPDTVLLAGLSLTRGIPELWQVRPMGTAGLHFLSG